ncbi:hypothetical protein B0H14DRAFT_3500312 [Mycena olivaceomarginata]|nr:hypothetical protein B0H14DRAFT_3500312 [Mycena olivaceomarginata]
MDSIAINTGNASEELGKAEELLRIYKKANTGAKNKLGGGGYKAHSSQGKVLSDPGSDFTR